MGDVSPFGMGDKEAAGCLNVVGVICAIFILVTYLISMGFVGLISTDKQNNRIERVHDSLEYVRLKEKLGK